MRFDRIDALGAGVVAVGVALIVGIVAWPGTEAKATTWNALARVNGAPAVVSVEAETVEFVDTGDLGACVRFSTGGETVALLCGVEAVARKEGER